MDAVGLGNKIIDFARTNTSALIVGILVMFVIVAVYITAPERLGLVRKMGKKKKTPVCDDQEIDSLIDYIHDKQKIKV